MPDALLTFAAVAGLDPEAKGFPLSADDRKKLVDDLSKCAHTFEKLAPFELGEHLLGFLGGALRTPVADLLKEMWRQQKELTANAKKGTETKPVVGEVTLHDHTMSLTVHPTVAVSINGIEQDAMRFDVMTSAKLEAVRLVMRNTRITGFKAGRLKVSVAMSFKQFPLMAPREKVIDLSREFLLPAGGIPLV